MSSSEELGMAFRKAGMEMGVVLHINRRNMPKPEDTVFNFYINWNGDIQTTSDPFDLARLMMVGHYNEDENGDGDHKIMLNSFASEEELKTPSRYSEKSYGHVQWDYDFETPSPSISFRDWLVRELNKASNHEQRRVRHEFLKLLAQIEGTELNFVEKYLWWLPL